MSKIHYSCGKDKYDNCPEQLVAESFAELIAHLEGNRSNKKGKRYVCGPMTTGPHDDVERFPGDNHWRLKNRADKVRFLAKDFDGFRDLQAMGDVVNYLGERFPCYFYTTASHTDSEPRGRLIIEANREMNRNERIAASEVLEAELKDKFGDDVVKFDTSVYRAEQPCYAPLTGAFTRIFKGKEAFDVDEYLTRRKPSKAEKPPLSELSKVLLSTPEISLPESTENIEAVRSALYSISPDIPYEGEEGNWRDVVWAVCSLGWGRRGKQLIKEWSEASERYTEEGLEKVLNSYSPDRTDAVGIGTLFYQAKKAGWVDLQSPQIVGTEDLVRYQPAGDILSGRVFATKYVDFFLWVNVAGKWLRWDRTRWAWCETGEEMQAAKKAADLILDHASALFKQDNERFGGKLKFAYGLQNSGRLKAMLEMATSEDGMAIGSMVELDSNPDLICARNGEVNLKTGELLKSDPAHLITRQVAAHYSQTELCLRWLKFLTEIFDGNQEVIDFVQRALGYSLTGHNTEEVLIICHGFGANGKSIFSNVITAIAGDYANVAPSSVLVHQGNDTGARNDLASLCGSRIVQINETQGGDKLDERSVKLLAGREPISARFLYHEHFSFMPTFTGWLRTNHKPIITGTDDGIWRRIILLAFPMQFKGKNADPWLEKKLLAERDGILAWIVEGAKEWYRNGLQVPTVIRRESISYRLESDVLREFLKDHTRKDPSGRVEQAILWRSWQSFCYTVGLSEGSKNSFTRRLAERGYGVLKSHGVRYYKGLAQK